MLQKNTTKNVFFIKLGILLVGLLVLFSSNKIGFAQAVNLPAGNTAPTSATPAVAAGDWCLTTEIDAGGGVKKTVCIAGGVGYETKELCEETTKGKCNQIYKLLAPLPFIGTEIETGGSGTGLSQYLNLLFRLGIGVAGILAVIMIIIAGFEYMGTDSIFKKTNAIGRIQAAVGGLILALVAFIILETIDPKFLNIGLILKQASLDIAGDANTPFSPATTAGLQAIGISCPKTGGKAALPTIANSFNKKVTYNQQKRGTASSNTVYLDCSSFVAQVYSCAGLSSPGSYTGAIFGGGTIAVTPNSISSDGTTFNGNQTFLVGDLLGWKAGDSKKNGFGHVVIYVGNGNITDVHGEADILNAAYGPIRPLGSYKHKKEIKYVKRL